MEKSLENIKDDLLKLSSSLDCNKVIISDCYIVNEVAYSVSYNKKENKFYKFSEDLEPTEV